MRKNISEVRLDHCSTLGNVPILFAIGRTLKNSVIRYESAEKHCSLFSSVEQRYFRFQSEETLNAFLIWDIGNRCSLRSMQWSDNFLCYQQKPRSNHFKLTMLCINYLLLQYHIWISKAFEKYDVKETVSVNEINLLHNQHHSKYDSNGYQNLSVSLSERFVPLNLPMIHSNKSRQSQLMKT